MCRLIDADELLETIEKNSYILCDAYNSKDKGMFITGIAQAVTEQSTVDIVRCKDCMKRSNLLCPMAKLDRHYNIIISIIPFHTFFKLFSQLLSLLQLLQHMHQGSEDLPVILMEVVEDNL